MAADDERGLTMGKLDIAILLLVSLGGLSCFRAGFTRSVWGITALSAGVFSASQLWQELAPVLQHVIQHEGIAKWVSIVVIAVGVCILTDIVLDQLQTIMERGVLRWINNIVGAAFGVAAASILIGLGLMLLERYGGEGVKEAIAHSRFAPTLLEIANQVFNFSKSVIEEQIEKM